MVPAVFNRQNVVIVQGVPVVITVDGINDYLQLVRPQGLELTYGLAPHPAFENPLSEQVARSLRRDGRGRWDVENTKIRKSALLTELAFWSLFIKCNLRPSTHHTYIDSDVGRLLFSIQHGLEMDIGHIIHLDILDVGATVRSKLPFPCLITHFCRQAGIAAASEPAALKRPRRDLGGHVYQAQEQTHETDEERAARRAARAARAQPQAHPEQQPMGSHSDVDIIQLMQQGFADLRTDVYGHMDRGFRELRTDMYGHIDMRFEELRTEIRSRGDSSHGAGPSQQPGGGGTSSASRPQTYARRVRGRPSDPSSSQG